MPPMMATARLVILVRTAREQATGFNLINILDMRNDFSEFSVSYPAIAFKAFAPNWYPLKVVYKLFDLHKTYKNYGLNLNMFYFPFMFPCLMLPGLCTKFNTDLQSYTHTVLIYVTHFHDPTSFHPDVRGSWSCCQQHGDTPCRAATKGSSGSVLSRVGKICKEINVGKDVSSAIFRRD